MSRSLQNPTFSGTGPRLLDMTGLDCHSPHFAVREMGARIAALSIEFVAKPNEAHKVQTALPAALQGALGEVAGFAGSLVLIANHEARLVTVITLWRGEDRSRRCGENVRWVRALLGPYLDSCLRVQTLAAYAPEIPQTSGKFEGAHSGPLGEEGVGEEEAVCVA